MSPFFDTNILIYAQQTGAKGDRARGVIALGGTVSVQVLNEFAAVCHRKLARTWDEIGAAIDDVLALVGPPVALTVDIHTAARALAAADKIAFCDALIIAAAQEAGCDVLFSEDLQDGRAFGAVRIQNPFGAQ